MLIGHLCVADDVSEFAPNATVAREFEWVLYLFAAFLIATGVKMLLSAVHPTAGEARLFGRNAKDPEARRPIVAIRACP